MHDAKVILDFVSKCRNYFMSIGFALISDNLGIRDLQGWSVHNGCGMKMKFNFVYILQLKIWLYYNKKRNLKSTGWDSNKNNELKMKLYTSSVEAA